MRTPKTKGGKSKAGTPAPSRGRAKKGAREGAAKRQEIISKMQKSDFSQTTRGKGDGGQGQIWYGGEGTIRKVLNAVASSYTMKRPARKGK